MGIKIAEIVTSRSLASYAIDDILRIEILDSISLSGYIECLTVLDVDRDLNTHKGSRIPETRLNIHTDFCLCRKARHYHQHIGNKW